MGAESSKSAIIAPILRQPYPETSTGLASIAAGQAAIIAIAAATTLAVGYYTIVYYGFDFPEYQSLGICLSEETEDHSTHLGRLSECYTYLLSSCGIFAAMMHLVGRYAPSVMSEELGSTREGIAYYITLFVVAVACSQACETIPYDQQHMSVKILFWLFNSVTMTLMYHPIIFNSLATFGYPSALTGVWVSILFLLSQSTETGFFDSLPIAQSTAFVYVAGIAKGLAPPHSEMKELAEAIYSYFGFLVASACFCQDNQNIIQQTCCRTEFDPICAANVLFANLLQIYVRLNMLLDGSQPWLLGDFPSLRSIIFGVENPEPPVVVPSSMMLWMRQTEMDRLRLVSQSPFNHDALRNVSPLHTAWRDLLHEASLLFQ